MPTSPEITPKVRAFLEGRLAATIATTGTDGVPHVAAIWYRLEPDGRILVNSRVGRRWPTNLGDQPRCAFSFIDQADWNRWVAVEAVVDQVVTGAAAHEDIVALSVRYDEASPESEAAFRSQERITYLLRPVAVSDQLGDA